MPFGDTTHSNQQMDTYARGICMKGMKILSAMLDDATKFNSERAVALANIVDCASNFVDESFGDEDED